MSTICYIKRFKNSPAAFYRYDEESREYILFDTSKMIGDYEPQNNFEEWVLRKMREIPVGDNSPVLDPEDVPF